MEETFYIQSTFKEYFFETRDAQSLRLFYNVFRKNLSEWKFYCKLIDIRSKTENAYFFRLLHRRNERNHAMPYIFSQFAFEVRIIHQRTKQLHLNFENC